MYNRKDAVAAQGSSPASVFSGVSVVGGGVCLARASSLEADDLEWCEESPPLDILRNTVFKFCQ